MDVLFGKDTLVGTWTKGTGRGGADLRNTGAFCVGAQFHAGQAVKVRRLLQAFDAASGDVLRGGVATQDMTTGAIITMVISLEVDDALRRRGLAGEAAHTWVICWRPRASWLSA